MIPLDDEGRVLLARQTESGTYGTVGGAVDVDESPRLADVEALRPDGDEVDRVRWFRREELGRSEVGPFAQATFGALR